MTGYIFLIASSYHNIQRHPLIFSYTITPFIFPYFGMSFHQLSPFSIDSEHKRNVNTKGSRYVVGRRNTGLRLHNDDHNNIDSNNYPDVVFFDTSPMQALRFGLCHQTNIEQHLPIKNQ